MDRSSDSLPIVHWGRRTAGALCAAAAVWLTGCGGGGESVSPTAGPPSSRAPVDEGRAAALVLYESGALASRLGQNLLWSLSIGTRCVFDYGTVELHIDGSPANKLPAGSHTFSATFDACLIDGLVGSGLHGAISGDYSLTGEYDYGAQLSFRTLSGFPLAVVSDLSDVTGEGSLTLTSVSTGIVNSTAFAYTTTVAPVGGFKLVNVMGNAMTFGGGSYSSSYDTASETGSDDFNGLEVEINGVHYTLQGNIQWSISGHTRFRYTSGVVRITSGGVLHASVAGQASGALLVEVFVPLERL